MRPLTLPLLRAALFLALAIPAAAQVPRLISFQGVLADPSGALVADGTHTLRLALYDAATGGTPIHTETQSVPVIRGIFNAIIGAATGIDIALSFDRAYYLGVTVDDGPELTPRTPLTAAPYAMRAAIADFATSADALAPTASGVVRSVNGEEGAITIAGAGGTTVAQSDGVVTITSATEGSGGFTLPFSDTVNTNVDAFHVRNAGLGGAASFTYANGGSDAAALTATTLGTGSAILGRIGIGTGGALASTPAIRGESGAGTGVAGLTTTGTGIYAYATTGTGVFASSQSRAVHALAQGTTATSYGVFAQSTSPTGIGVYGFASQSGTLTTGVSGESNSTANGTGAPTGSSGVLGTNSNINAGAWSAGVRGVNAGGTTNSNGVIGYASGAGKGVYGEATTGVGVYGKSSTGNSVLAYTNGAANALWVQHDGAGASTTANNNLAVFNANGGNVARIDRAGKGYFNGGTQTGGADVAESFDVAGDPGTYEPGDVLVIATSAARTVERSSSPYSTLVAGVLATKPGVLLSERDVDADHTDRVPMGVVGVIPTKVTLENGPIAIGDLIVTSSTSGHAMRADPAVARDHPGCILGKALESYDGSGAARILVLVSVK